MGSILQHLFRARGTSEVQPLQKSVPPPRVAPGGHVGNAQKPMSVQRRGRGKVTPVGKAALVTAENEDHDDENSPRYLPTSSQSLLDVDGDEDENVARRAGEKQADETAGRFDAGENAGLFAQRGHARRQNDLSGQPRANEVGDPDNGPIKKIAATLGEGGVHFSVKSLSCTPDRTRR